MAGSSPAEWASVIVNGIAAFGTLLAVVVAIWGETIKAVLFPFDVELGVESPGTRTVTNSGRPVILRHLRITKTKGPGALKSCRVLLVEQFRLNEMGNWEQVALPVPLQLVWAPAVSSGSEISLSHDHLVDFGYLDKVQFAPAFYGTPADFKGQLSAKQSMRYVLEIRAENLSRPATYTLEVEWDGEFLDTAVQMLDHLKVRRVARA